MGSQTVVYVNIKKKCFIVLNVLLNIIYLDQDLLVPTQHIHIRGPFHKEPTSPRESNLGLCSDNYIYTVYGGTILIFHVL